MNSAEKVLVVLANRGLADGVAVLPLCHAIRRHRPGTHLTVGYFRDTERVVLEMCPILSGLVRLSSLKTKHLRHWWQLTTGLVRVLRAMSGYDVIILLHTSDRHWPMFALARLTGARILDKRVAHLSDRPPLALLCHKLMKQLLQVDEHTSTLTHWPAMRVPDEAGKYAEDFFRIKGLSGKKTIFLNPYRASKQTGWRIERYFRVAETLVREGIGVVVHEKGGMDEKLGIAGVRDKATVKALHRYLSEIGVSVAGETSMAQLVALISRCDMLFGEPSGPAWVAAVLGRPTVTVAHRPAESLESFLPLALPGSSLSSAKHVVILNEESKAVQEAAVVTCVRQKLATCVSDCSADVSDIPLSSQMTMVLGGANAEPVRCCAISA